MKEWIHRIEIIVDKIIPFLLIILLIIIIMEFAYPEEKIKPYRITIEIIDIFIIAVFATDLVFKYIKIRKIPEFLKECWLDIISVFPFFLLFRAFEAALGLFELSEATAQTQKVIHIGAGVERELGGIVKEGSKITEEATKISRAEKFSRFLRPLTRSLRFLKLGDEHIRKEAKKDVEEGEKFIKATIFYEKPGISYHHLYKKKSFINKKRAR